MKEKRKRAPGAGRKPVPRPVCQKPVYLYHDQTTTPAQAREWMDIATIARLQRAMIERWKANPQCTIMAIDIDDELCIKVEVEWKKHGESLLAVFHPTEAHMYFNDGAMRDDYWEMFSGSVRAEFKLWYLLSITAQVANAWLKAQYHE